MENFFQVGHFEFLPDHDIVAVQNIKSAQGNFGTAQQIVRQFIGDKPDIIVTITTVNDPPTISKTV